MIGGEPNGVVAVFATTDAASRALESLQGARFDMRSVSVLGPGHANGALPPELDHSARHSTEVGSFWGLWGSIVGGAVGGGVIAIPVIAAVVGLGPFAPVLAAIAIGTTGASALASALVGYGVHEAHALTYERALREGKTIVVVHTDVLSRLEDARVLLSAAAPEHLDTHGLHALGGHVVEDVRVGSAP